jgi:hypothetical protein
MTPRAKLWLILVVLILAVAAVFMLPPIPQNEAYHRFADTRTLLGVPNCLNTLSNVLFLVVGALGMFFLYGKGGENRKMTFLEPAERWPYLIFFVGVGLTALGSSFYHLFPGDDRLVWDRLPMTLAFMSLLAAVIGERTKVETGTWMLLPLLAAGAASVVYWNFTQKLGRGDLRFYALVQFGGLLAVLLFVLFLSPRYSRSADLLVALGIYVFAKLLESFDQSIFDAGRMISGHTLKHLAAALGGYWVLRMLKLRISLARASVGQA